MATAKKTKAGNWRIQVYDYTDSEGKLHRKSFTADTKAEAEYLAASFVKSKSTRTATDRNDWTVIDVIELYIKLCDKISPTTLDGYNKIKRYAFQDIMHTKVSKLDDIAMQLAVNREADRISERTKKKISAKTVENEWGLLASAISAVCKKNYRIKLPEHQKHIKIYPEPQTVLAMIHGTDIELPCLLAMWLSFSMSEIRGLECGDIQGDYIIINRVIVDTNKGPVVKDNAKVETRLRMHRIPPYIMQLINCTTSYTKYAETGENGPLITYSRDHIVRTWKKLCKSAGLDLTFHDLRHMSASVMLLLNVPEKYAMERGGWKTPHIMQNVYQHTLSAERVMVDDRIDDYFSKMLTNL